MLTKFFVPLSKSGFYTKRVSKSINNSLHSLTQRAVVGSDQRLSSSNFCFESVEIEYCFYVAHAKELSVDELNLLHWILTDPFGYSPVFSTSLFASELPLEPTQFVLELELGPRGSFSSAFSANAVSITRAAGISSISRIECSRRFRIFFRVTGDAAASLSGLRSGRVLDELREFLAAPLHDRMTECLYLRSLDSLSPPIDQEARCRVEVLPVIEEGERTISEFNARECLALDDWDVHFYTSVFRELGRNPTTIELFDLAQSNSEHCRHWFFKGDCVIDGVLSPRSLLQMVCDTQRSSNPNNTIKFSDNSSAIAGFAVTHLTPSDPTSPSPFTLVQSHFSKGNTSMQSEEALTDILFTAETHNFPTAVCPFEGAATGSGGRIRDVHATGRGAHVGVGTIGYAVGSLDDLPHVFDLLDSMSIRMSLDSDTLSAFNKRPEERASSKYRSAGFADPISILIEGSNGASDYGNKFGEPLVLGALIA